MAKVYLICGKICCGKTTYANKICVENNAVLLSVDEITLALFGQHCGDKHDEYVERTEKYLLNKSLELIENNINVFSTGASGQKQNESLQKSFINPVISNVSFITLTLATKCGNYAYIRETALCLRKKQVLIMLMITLLQNSLRYLKCQAKMRLMLFVREIKDGY